MVRQRHGDYPDAIRQELRDLVFGDEGLNLNIARYNIGGGNAPSVEDYLRPGGAVEGWWKAPAGPQLTPQDKDWWDPADPALWNEDADATQRWWIDAIKADITHWEAFNNSPPWFQTVSGYVSGGFDPSAEQIRADTVDDFAAYLVGAMERLEAAHGITFDTVDPLNEPNTPYWGTQLGADGQPTGGRQEGAHAGPAMQARVITALEEALAASDLDTPISAMDETNPGTFVRNWYAYDQPTQDLVEQLNVHTYGTGQRTSARDLAKGEGKPLWMSEVEGSWGAGQSFTDMAPGLGMAERITDDLRELEPDAWVFWQPVEDLKNMEPGGESAAGANWGSIQLDFDCGDGDVLVRDPAAPPAEGTCRIKTNTKFDTVRNYTHYIEPGDRLVATDSTDSTAALTDEGVTVVHVNDSDAARDVTLDLAKFASVADGATVTPVVTSTAGALRTGTPTVVRDGEATLRLPARSVTTLLVSDVSGVAEDAALVQEDHVYRLRGVQSGKSLAPAATGSGVVIRTDSASAPDQVWRLRPLADSVSNRQRYTLSTGDGALLLAAGADDPTLVAADTGSTPAESAQWMLSTTGDGTYTVVNAGTGQLLDVPGGATADGTRVAFYTPTSGDNQRWRILDETVQGVRPTAVVTPVGVAPSLPASVTGVYAGGDRDGLPVVWDLPADSAWQQPGTVVVPGIVTTSDGQSLTTTAEVTVDTLVSTRPARAATYVGQAPTLPTTVTAVGESGATVERPVTWETASADAFDQTGVVELEGVADAGAGRTLPATVAVRVTEPVPGVVPTPQGTTVAATFTEPGYGTAGLLDGDLGDKAWSNWRSSAKNTSDTLTMTFPDVRTLTGLRGVFFKDGASDSYPASVRVEVPTGDGGWRQVGETTSMAAGLASPVVTVTFPGVEVDRARLVMTARDNTHLTMSELQVLGQVAAQGSDAGLAELRVAGTPLPGFDPARESYTVTSTQVQQVAARAADPFATVEVQQAGDGRTARVVVTSEDGSATRTYAVTFQAPGTDPDPQPAGQTIIFAKPSDMEVGDPDQQLFATATSGLGVSFRTDGPCTVTVDRLRATGVGACTVTASQAGDATYAPAPEVERTVVVTETVEAPVEPEPEPEPVLVDGFEEPGRLDDAWVGSTSRADYRVTPRGLRVGRGGPILHTGSRQGADQEAAVTLERVAPGARSLGLLLEAQGQDGFRRGLAVTWNPQTQRVRLAVKRSVASAWTRSVGPRVDLAEGDVLGARTVGDRVEVLRDGEVVATFVLEGRAATAFVGRGGHVGIWAQRATGSVLDDLVVGPATGSQE
ncbi:Ig-like domain-containing protein [Nocardioides sp. Leaf285]|uniref:Ig-like domain-containing protein n=1 Tax=Nocardioides sp. Leaf285 TaxID=1736322 RepID=UPI000A77DD5B|nr:Ig-like domain-containing protein [Nocardioides sp. Leaf285]